MLPYFRSMEAFFNLSLPKDRLSLSDRQLLFFLLPPLPRQDDGRKPHSQPIQMGWATLLCHSNSDVFVRHDTPLHLPKI